MNTASIALFLAANVGAIACDEQAGDCYADIRAAVDAIDRMINRPIPPRYCGPCPAVVGDAGETCDTALLADRKATEVQCWSCHTLHDVDTIEQELWARVDEWLLSPSEITMVMDYFGEPVPPSTIRRWKMEGKLPIRGYRDGKPRYWSADVRRLRNGKTAA